MRNRKILFIGRWKLYEKIRRIVFEDVLELRYASSERELDSNMIVIVDKALERQLARRARSRFDVVDDADLIELMAELAHVFSRHSLCREVVIGVDPGPDSSGISLVQCGIPTLHAVVSTHLLNRLVKLLLERGLDVTLCVGVSGGEKKTSLSMMVLFSLGREVPLYVINERETKYRRKIFRHMRQDLARRGNVTSHELDAVVYALSVDSAIRFKV